MPADASTTAWVNAFRVAGSRLRWPSLAPGSLQLREYPTSLVRLSCAKCGRSGQYRKQNLTDRYGADIRLPDLREEIAQCGRQGKMHDAWMVHYVDLKL